MNIVNEGTINTEKLTSKDADTDDDVNPFPDLTRGIGSVSAHSRIETVICLALLISVTCLANRLVLNAKVRLSIAIETHTTVSPTIVCQYRAMTPATVYARCLFYFPE